MQNHETVWKIHEKKGENPWTFCENKFITTQLVLTPDSCYYRVFVFPSGCNLSSSFPFLENSFLTKNDKMYTSCRFGSYFTLGAAMCTNHEQFIKTFLDSSYFGGFLLISLVRCWQLLGKHLANENGKSFFFRHVMLARKWLFPILIESNPGWILPGPCLNTYISYCI